MSFPHSIPFLERWSKLRQPHHYTTVAINSTDDIEEEKSLTENHILESRSINRRRKWLCAVLLALLWLSSAALLSLIGPAVLKLFQTPEGAENEQWFPEGNLAS